MGRIESHGFLLPTPPKKGKLQQEARWEQRSVLRLNFTVAVACTPKVGWW